MLRLGKDLPHSGFTPGLTIGRAPPPSSRSAAFALPHPDSSCSYQGDPGTGYPSGYPGPSVANILRRGGRPAEVRHVPHNKGVGCHGVDNLALDALPTVPLWEANRG